MDHSRQNDNGNIQGLWRSILMHTSMAPYLLVSLSPCLLFNLKRRNMILLLDNYDSFTYNLFQYLSELGADVLVKRNDELSVGDVAALAPAKIVISPGPCTPNEAGISVALIRELGGTMPILGVCLGHQSIGAGYGGAVVRAPQVMHGKLSAIHHEGAGVFAGLPPAFQATRYHSLIVRRDD